MSAMTAFEKRKYARITSKYSINCERIPSFGQVEKIRTSGSTKNVSATGLLFETFLKFSPNDQVRVEMYLPGWKNPISQTKSDASFVDTDNVHVMLADVVRVREVEKGKYDVGVRFLEHDKKRQWEFMNFIYDDADMEVPSFVNP
jgi:c-di-GMP-binding flagellar brake protein YcgR